MCTTQLAHCNGSTHWVLLVVDSRTTFYIQMARSVSKQASKRLFKPSFAPPTVSSPPLLSASSWFQVPIVTFSLLLSKLQQQYPNEVSAILKGIEALRSLARHGSLCIGGWPYLLLDTIAAYSETAVSAYSQGEIIRVP